jgi:ribose transport system substrate-binding protein
MSKVMLAFGAAALAAAGALSAPALATAQEAAEPYVIYLSNNFMGNDWRQQMIRVGQVAAGKDPLASRVDLRVENVENTVQAQINSLNNIVREQPDAILIDAGPTARSIRRSREPATRGSSSSVSTRR